MSVSDQVFNFFKADVPYNIGVRILFRVPGENFASFIVQPVFIVVTVFSTLEV
jgi:hypothetical protein